MWSPRACMQTEDRGTPLYNRMLICACTRRTCICGNRESLPRTLIIYALHSSLKNVDMIGCNNNKYMRPCSTQCVLRTSLSLDISIFLYLPLSLFSISTYRSIYIYLFMYRFYEYIYIYRAGAGGLIFEPTTRMQSAWLILL